MAVSIEEFAEVIATALAVEEETGVPVTLTAKYRAKTGDREGVSEWRTFIATGEVFTAKSSGLASFYCEKLDGDEPEFRVYNVGRFMTLPQEVATVEA